MFAIFRVRDSLLMNLGRKAGDPEADRNVELESERKFSSPATVNQVPALPKHTCAILERARHAVPVRTTLRGQQAGNSFDSES